MGCSTKGCVYPEKQDGLCAQHLRFIAEENSRQYSPAARILDDNQIKAEIKNEVDEQFRPRITVESHPAHPGHDLWCVHYPGGKKEYRGWVGMIALQETLEKYHKVLAKRGISVPIEQIEIPVDARETERARLAQSKKKVAPKYGLRELPDVDAEFKARTIDRSAYTVKATERTEERVETRVTERSVTATSEQVSEVQLPAVPTSKQILEVPFLPPVSPPVSPQVEQELVTLFREVKAELEEKGVEILALKHFDLDAVLPTSTDPLSYLPEDGPEAKKLLDVSVRYWSSSGTMTDEEVDEMMGETLPNLGESCQRYRKAKEITDKLLAPWVERNGLDECVFGEALADLWKSVHAEITPLLGKRA